MRKDVRWNEAGLAVNPIRIPASFMTGAARFAVGVIGWLLWIRLSYLAIIMATGLALSLVDPSVERPTLEVIVGYVVFTGGAVFFGWLGALAANRLRIDRPVWWAPSVVAMTVLVLTSVFARPWDSSLSALRQSFQGAIEMLPIVLGQLLAVRGRRRPTGSPRTDSAVGVE